MRCCTLCVGDDDFDENEEYLKYDYSLSCTTPEYLHGWRVVAILMTLVYPVGIPCVYLFLVYRERPFLNPEPMFVIVDVEKDGVFSARAGVDGGEPQQQVQITKEMKQLAKSALLLRNEAHRHRIKSKSP